jgi:hypothetical protein
MTEPLFQMLDAVNIDEGRHYIEFRFSDFNGEPTIIQIDFDYLEPLSGVLGQAFTSAALEGRQGSNRLPGGDWVSVPRVDVDERVNVGADIMTGKIVTMMLLGSPYQVCYALPIENARALAHELLAACDQVQHHDATTSGARPN